MVRKTVAGPYRAWGMRSKRGRVLALLLASTVLGGVPPLGVARAQAQQVAPGAMAFQIPAQPLSSAIDAFIRQSGWQISYSSELLRGKTSPGVSGTLAPEAALQGLVAGTGVAVRLGAPESAALVDPAVADAAAEPSLTLDTIVVGSSYETEGTNSYTSDLISVGEKSVMSQREVPQSTSVVTNTQIRNNSYTSLDSALNDVPGVLVWANDEGRSSIYLRGFELDRLYYDGLPMEETSINATQPDLSTIDHIEVLKGPAGLFNTAGSPAGAMNMRLKQATRTDPGGYVSAQVDGNGRYRGELDYGGALNREGTVRGRAVLAYTHGDGFVDKVENGVTSAYGTIAWDITPDTLATFSLSHMEKDIKPFNGLPTYADGSLIWTDAGATTAADWNHFDNSITNAVAALEHRFGNGARVKFALRQSHHTADYHYAWAGAAANADNTVNRLSWLARDWKHDSTALDAHAEIPFMLGGWDGSAIVGADYERSKSTTKSATGTITGSWDLDDWDVSGVAKPTVNWASITRAQTTTKGIYGQVRIKPTAELALIGGARASWYDDTTTNLLNGSTSRLKESGKLTPFAGVTYDLTASTTLYASYSEIFQPQSYQDADGNTLKPMTSGQYEIGVKSEYDGVNLTAAIFDLRQRNVAQLVTTGVYETAAEVRSRGIELTAAGELYDNLHLSAGYTYNETEYTKGADAGEAYSTYTPRNMLKVGLLYDVTEGPAAGWSFGGQMRAMTNFSSVSGATTIKAPGYAVFDLTAIRHLGEDTDLRIGVANVLDKDYYARVGSTAVFNFRGEPRTLMLAMTHRF
ncbi:TonB-dependent siderophore receptor [Paenirhodobacter populi]|nr:TonB-dependent siderophore receptor [Sinirhodobacter populi]